jgi:transcriptional regulator with XRE-family HTH domain
LLRHRGRTGLTQRELAARAGVSLRSVQDWESGVNYPSAPGLQALIVALLNAGSFGAGRETEEAQALWTAVECEAARMRTPFDSEWITRLVVERSTQTDMPGGRQGTTDAVIHGSRASTGARDQRQDWGEARLRRPKRRTGATPPLGGRALSVVGGATWQRQCWRARSTR